MGVNAPQQPPTPPSGSTGGSQPTPPSGSTPPSGNPPTTPPTTPQGGDSLAEFFNQGDSGGNSLLGQAFDTAAQTQAQTAQTLRSTAAVYQADVGRAMQGAQQSEGQGRSDRAEQSTRHRGESSRADEQRSDTYRARGDTQSRDHRSKRESGLRGLEKRQGEAQGADKTRAGDSSAVRSALRRGTGESEGQHQARLLRGTRASDQDGDQAFNRLPAQTRSQLQTSGRTDQAKQYLKFQLQMNRLQTLKQEALDAGDTELAEQLQAAMDQLSTEAPEIPPELTAAEGAEEAEGAEDSDETDDAEDVEDSGDGGTTGTGESGDTARRVGTASDTGEQAGGDTGGDDQAQTGGAAAQISQASLSPSFQRALDEGQLGSVFHTGGSDQTGGLMATEHRVLGSIVKGDGSRISILADSGDQVRLVRQRSGQGSSEDEGEGFDPQPLESRGLQQGSLKVDPHAYGGETRLQFSAATGGTGTIGIYQLQAALERTPPGSSHVEIGNRYLEIEEVDQASYAGMVGAPTTLTTGEASEAVAYHRQVGLIRARGLVGRGWSANMDSFAQTGFLPAQVC